MARDRSIGSPTKEFPIDRIDATIRAINPGMTYSELRTFADANTNTAIPGVLRKRFLLVNGDQIQYDLFLSVANAEGLDTPRIRKIMYFLWMYRSERHRRFICEVVADRNGQWRPNQLTRRQNYTFFEQFYSESTAIKARSNLEYFLTEIGVYDHTDHSVHLELDDGWLPDAVAVASQHEREPITRRQMLGNPVEFLIANGLNALANASVDELRSAPPAVAIDADPLEDEAIDVDGPHLGVSHRWNRPAPTPTSRRSAIVSRDPIRIERANAAHHRLEVLLNQAATALGYIPQENRNIDMHFNTPVVAVIAEMKNCHRNNLHAQIRRGISQLLEYRYVYLGLLGPNPTSLLLLETRPITSKEWMIAYAASLNILIAWRNQADDRLVTTATIPASLTGIIVSA